MNIDARLVADLLKACSEVAKKLQALGPIAKK